MGSLAVWGAVASAGEGWGKGIQLEAAAKENEKDRKHNEKLAELQMQADHDRSLNEMAHEEYLQGQKDNTDWAIAGLNAGVDQAAVDQRREAATAASADKRYAADAAASSRVEAAGIRATAAEKASDDKGFTYSQETVQIMDPQTNRMEERTTSLASHKGTGMRFFQDGAQLIPATVDPKTGMAAVKMPTKPADIPTDEEYKNVVREDTKELKANPDLFSAFLERYGFIPAEYFMQK